MLNTPYPTTGPLSDDSGFSLIEVLVALLLLAIITIAINQFYISKYNTWVSQDIVAEMEQSGKIVMDKVSREMQLAGRDLKASGEKAVIDASPTRFTFISTDVDIEDINRQTRKVSIYFDKSNNELKMSVTARDKSSGSYGAMRVETLTGNVTSLEFTYYNDRGDIVHKPEDVRRVKVTMTIKGARKDPATGDYRSMTLVTGCEIQSVM